MPVKAKTIPTDSESHKIINALADEATAVIKQRIEIARRDGLLKDWFRRESNLSEENRADALMVTALKCAFINEAAKSIAVAVDLSRPDLNSNLLNGYILPILDAVKTELTNKAKVGTKQVRKYHEKKEGTK